MKDIQHVNKQVDYVNVDPQYEFEGGSPMYDDGHDFEQEHEKRNNDLGDIKAQVRHEDMNPLFYGTMACQCHGLT